jgi:hypothetical protein
VRQEGKDLAPKNDAANKHLRGFDQVRNQTQPIRRNESERIASNGVQLDPSQRSLSNMRVNASCGGIDMQTPVRGLAGPFGVRLLPTEDWIVTEKSDGWIDGSVELDQPCRLHRIPQSCLRWGRSLRSLICALRDHAPLQLSGFSRA